jgi:DNA replication protein DnaC
LQKKADYEGARADLSVRRANRIFQNAGIPPKFLPFTFDTIPDTKGKERAIAAARMYLDLNKVDPRRIQEYDPNLTPNGNSQIKRSLGLIGAPGMGKTGILSVTFQSMVKQGVEGLWIELYRMFHEIQSGYGKAGDDSATEKLKYAGEVPLLFLDDCGDPDRTHRGKVLRETNDKRQLLWQIIGTRHGLDRPTLITSNLTREEFARQWGERLAARVWEMAWVIPVLGKDLRS